MEATPIIGARYTLTWDGRTATLPAEFVVEVAGLQYLKFQPSHRTFVKLLLGCEEGRGSLTSSKGVEELKELRDRAVLNHLKSSQSSGGEKLFASSEDEPRMPKTAVTVDLPEYVTVEGIQIGLAEKHSPKKDLLVLFNDDTLENFSSLR